MNIQKLKLAWFSGWRIVGRLFLLYLAMLLFWLPFLLAAELLPETAPQLWKGLIAAIHFLVILPISAYYAARWCKEFKDETE